ncbi:MAG: substrate-binding domain-containing protein [Oscillospiraceae bacterium]|nr:substrate-binding domain-containing protein [Oscillospiraceae bacterium]MBQ9332232.1 substrate-binding domain-containing protein [Oscillospiraceae bacterium]
MSAAIIDDSVKNPSCEKPSQTYSLGILFMDESEKGLTHPFFASVLNGFKIAAEARGYDVTFINQRVGNQVLTWLEYCRCRKLDGVCLACVDFVDAQVTELVRSEVPCVTVDHLFRGVPAVLSDNETGVQMLVEHAISLGHKRIAFVHGHNNSVVTHTRIQQFHQTMEFHGLPVPENYVCAGLYSDIPLTRELVKKLLRLPEPPTCILLPDDVCYFGAEEAARKLGLRVPGDVSFAGYDGIAMTQAIRPRLTTIRQNSEGLGAEAAARLIDIVEHPESANCLPSFQPVELLSGETVAVPI